EVQTHDVAAVGPRQVPGRATVARTDVQDAGLRRDGEFARHTFHSTLTGRCDLLISTLVEADVDVLTTPDRVVEVVRIRRVVVVPRRVDRAGIVLPARQVV